MAQYDLNLRDYWRVIKKRKFIIVFTVVAMGIFSLLFSLLWQPIPLYQATASIKVEKTGSITGLYIQTVSWSQTDYMQTQASIIKSYYIVEIAAKKLGLIPPDLSSEELHSNKKYQSVILELRNSVKTEQEGYSNILNISVISKNPEFARRLANTIAQVYKEQHVLDLNRRTFEAKNFIESQLTVVQKKLRESEESVRAFREKHELVSLDSQTSSLLNQKATLQAQYEKAIASRQKIGEVKNRLTGVGKAPLTSETSFYIDEASTLYKSLNDLVVRLMLERDTLLLTYTDEYPRVVELNQKIRETLENMKAQLLSQGQILQENIQQLHGNISHIDQRIKMLPELGLELARLEEKVQVNREVYLLLEKKYQEALIKEAEKIEEVQIVKPALEPKKPINPPKSKATTVVGTLLGLILGIVFAFVVETFDTSIGAIEEVEELTGVHALGIIPHVSLGEIKATLAAGGASEVDDRTAERYSRIVSHFAPKSTLAESYRALRTNLKFSGLRDGTKVIAFTSSSPQEGKSTVVANLAITMAQDRKKVLLIDGDLRKPMVAHIFGIEQIPGLSDIILGNYSWKDTVRTVSDIMMGKMSVDDVMMTPGMDNLNIITSGTIPPNPSELVSAEIIEELIEEAKSEYDLILWDAPPILSATDATILASKMEGVVMVYRVGKIARNTLKRAKAQLDNVRANVIGVVLNGLKAEISPDFTKHDYYKYYDYYGEGEREGPQKSWWHRVQSIPSTVSVLFAKSPVHGPTAEKGKSNLWMKVRLFFTSLKKNSSTESGQKKSSVKMIVLLLTLLLIIAAILSQMGYLKIPWISAAVPTEQRLKQSAEKRGIERHRISQTKNLREREQPGIETRKWNSSDRQTQQPGKIPAAVRLAADDATVSLQNSEGKTVSRHEEKTQEEQSNRKIHKPITVSDPAPSSKDAGTVQQNGEQQTTSHGEEKASEGTSKSGESASVYMIHIGSFRSLENAKNFVLELEKEGLDARWIPVHLKNSGLWYRVFVGRFAFAEDAANFKKERNLTGTYPSSRVLRVSSFSHK